MKTHDLPLIFCCAFLAAGCADNSISNKPPAEKPASAPATRPDAKARTLSVTPALFAERFNKCMEKQQKNSKIEGQPKIKDGPNQNTFQSTPTHQITIIGTVDKKIGHVFNVTLVARGNDTESMENIITHVTGIASGYKPDIEITEVKKEIRKLVTDYHSQKTESISKAYGDLKMTYGMQADMELNYFSIRPAEENTKQTPGGKGGI